MKAEKIVHNNEERIKIDFPYNQAIAKQLKQINGAKWSRTHKAWHIPYSHEAFRQLKAMFPEVEFPQTNKKSEPKSNQTVSKSAIQTDVVQDVMIRITEKRIFVKLPKNEKDIQQIRTLNYSRWDKTQFCWIIPNYRDNASVLKDYFNQRIKELIEEKPELKSDTRRRSKSELLVIKTSSGSLRIIFSYHKELGNAIKKFPYAKWSKENKWWIIPYAEKFIEELRAFAKEFQLNFVISEEAPGEKQSKISRYDIPNYRYCPEVFVNKMEELRYSDQTIKTYASLFEEFINYYHRFDIDRIDEPMIKAFMRYLVTERKVSVSYQNQSINAIKFYYERILGGQRKVYYIDRPRREKTLPTVLSEDEVADIINSVENKKHKAILITIYSAGLRIGELIRLKFSDIDSKRMQIRIEQGKGKKDRNTLLSAKTLDVLREYYREYTPQTWLFEGYSGKNYSRRSIQSILKNAVSKTNIKKKVTVHTLRHSFATHLLENGTDLRYIQSLMGHESSKTTEIYTHITTKGFDQIKSPIDKLNIL